jgi:PTH1 family peptidyl-tRNA hydrolase
MVQKVFEGRGRFKAGPKVKHATVRIGVVVGSLVNSAHPTTFMNMSGLAVVDAMSALACHYSDLIVVHDDVDIPFGRIQVRNGGKSGGHNGLRSIIEKLGTDEFVRLRIGVGRPSEGIDTADYVLSPFNREEREVLKTITDRAAEAVIEIVRYGPASAANIFNGNANV